MNTQQKLKVLNFVRKEGNVMRDIRSEVLRDVLYYALRQVLRDQNQSTKTLRKAYDVVYYQVNDIYYTLSLFVDIDGLYVTRIKEQYYNGDIRHEYAFKHHKEESRIVDIMNHLYFYVTEIFTNTNE